MGPFTASLKVPGERSALAATLHVEDGRLKIVAGDQAIGDWSLQEIDLSRLAGAYRMTAEGEQLLIEMQDLTGFEEAVDSQKKQKKQRRGRKRSKPAKQKTAEAETPETSSTQVKTAEAREEKVKIGSRVITLTDELIVRAERRFGDLLPSWVFSRVVVGLIVIMAVITIFLPGLVSVILLMAGLAVVVFGAVLYTDDRSAAKMLPGRMTPTHVLIVGVGFLLLGVLVGVIA